MFAKAIGDEYIAGLWKTDIVMGMLWTRVRATDGVDSGLRRSLMKAPSWSWISLVGSVCYYLEGCNSNCVAIQDMSFPPASPSSDVYTDLEPVSITLTGKILSLTSLLGLRVCDQEVECHIDWSRDEIESGDPKYPHIVLFDAPADDPYEHRRKQVFALIAHVLVHVNKRNHIRHSITALLLHRVDDDATYRRIGIVKPSPVPSSILLSKVPIQRITVV